MDSAALAEHHLDQLAIAPRAVFDTLTTRRDAARFMVRDAEGWSPVTWGAFAGDIRRVTAGLAARSMAPGERAAIFAPNRVAWASAAMGIQAGGGVMVPIYPSSTAEQAGYVIEHCDAVALFVDTEPLLRKLADAHEQLGAVHTIVVFDDALMSLRAEAALAPIAERLVGWQTLLDIGARFEADAGPDWFDERLNAVSLDDLGLMLYTSGTSGRPKGVPLTHRNVATNGQDWLQCNAPLLEFEADTDLLWLPMSHIFGFGEMCLGNSLGFTTWMSDPIRVLGELPEVKPTVFMSVPSLWEKLAMAALAGPEAERKERLAAVTGGRLRFCLSGGAGLKLAVKEVFRECGLLIIEGYGLTEASPTLTLNRPDAYRFDSVGRPLPQVALRLADDGEILARGPNVFAGYHKDPDASAEAFTDDGWLKTGDIGRFTDDGFLQIVDRKKDILVTAGGKNIAPANIEIRFRDEPLIDHVVVYGDSHKYLVAGVWPNQMALPAALRAANLDDTPENRRQLVQTRIDAVNAELARYETIKTFALMSPALTVENGLLTPTLKVKRKAVYTRFGEQLEALYQVNAPDRTTAGKRP